MKFLRKVVIKHLGGSLAALAFLLSTMSYGAPMGKVKFVDVDGVRTSYFEGGSGEAMVLVHGGSFGSTVSANCWSPIFEDLAAHFHVPGACPPPGSRPVRRAPSVVAYAGSSSASERRSDRVWLPRSREGS